MFIELIRIWSTVAGVLIVLWHSGYIARLYGWNIAKKTFYPRYLAAVKDRDLKATQFRFPL